ncbi:ATP-dependent DNA helicase RecG [Helicobacter sp. 11S02596-1]|uniref:ATP-dependent DNA helicase RecG n=1 Tax=Helicobacter sp. 11S02596-1 TaxID=1476194 RepID=UPI000BA64558|nr:ATP-dependent DNA helicase RecG [Helicobacter sp. 11S02596-1]PAF42135.1 ATP-dependent DNA helicase RecG [Helicobacter sp. 11S02596-1]
MKISPDDRAKLQKLGYLDLLAFATYIPKSYTDTSLITSLTPLCEGVVATHITQADFIRGKNIFKVVAVMEAFDEPLFITIFNAKSFHKTLYAIGKKLFVLGKIEYNFGHYAMTQPKIITAPGEIIANFKATALKSASISALAQKLLTEENLTEAGLPQKIACLIAEIFHPTKSFLLEYQKNNALPPRHLHALKWTEITAYLMRLSKKRRYFASKYICRGDYAGFIDSLPFELTSDQNSVIATIASDLAKPTASKRLIMGDVGCGKTIVILCSVVMAYPHKTLLMAPTTILAKQLYDEAQKFLPKHITTKLITADTKTDSKKNGQKKLFEEKADFIIGTQALLYREFQAEDFALIITDEQHRFGTKQRHQLEKLTEEKTPESTKKPHFLQFSATPIPRTMAMLNSSLIDFSFIKQLPFKKDITTKIIDKSGFSELLRHIQIEISQHRQVVIVYPLVEESQNFDYLSLKEGCEFWQKRFDNVYVTSGKDKDKEQVLEDFRDKGNILLATTLIEVGISLPKLSTIVIVGPERLGLATLHQLRGRVSRNGLKGYCFLYTNTKESERLKDFCAHLSGFDIAEIDLKYRNSGDLLGGERQSGAEFEFFDMSCDGEILSEVKQYLGI